MRRTFYTLFDHYLILMIPKINEIKLDLNFDGKKNVRADYFK